MDQHLGGSLGGRHACRLCWQRSRSGRGGAGSPSRDWLIGDGCPQRCGSRSSAGTEAAEMSILFPSPTSGGGRGRSKGPKPLTPVIDPVFQQRSRCEGWAVGPWVGNRPKSPRCFKTKVGNELLFEIIKAMFLGLCNLPQPSPQPQPTPHLAPGLLPPPHRAPPAPPTPPLPKPTSKVQRERPRPTSK